MCSILVNNTSSRKRLYQFIFPLADDESFSRSSSVAIVDSVNLSNFIILLNKMDEIKKFRRGLSQLRKVIYAETTANIILDGEKLDRFPLQSGTGPECLLLPLLLTPPLFRP